MADLGPMYAGRITGRLRHMFTDVLAVVDLAAILPYYMESYLPGGRDA